MHQSLADCTRSATACGFTGKQANHVHMSTPALAAKQKPIEAPLLVHPCIAIDDRLVAAVRTWGPP